MNQNKKFINVRKCDDHEQHQRYIESMLYLIKKHFELEKIYTVESVNFLRDNVDKHTFLKPFINKYENENAFVRRRIMYVKEYDTYKELTDDEENYNHNLTRYALAKVSQNTVDRISKFDPLGCNDLNNGPYCKFILNFDVSNRSSFMYVVTVKNDWKSIIHYDVFANDIREF